MNKSKIIYTKPDRNISFDHSLNDQRIAMNFTRDKLAEVVDRSTETIIKMERGLPSSCVIYQEHWLAS